jgi:capsid protein
VAWECVLEEAFLAGLWKLPLAAAGDFYRLKAQICRAMWIGPGLGWVDPEKELRASELGMKLGLTTWQIEAAEQGYHYLDLAAQVAVENRLRASLGMPIPGAVVQQVAATPDSATPNQAAPDKAPGGDEPD